MEQLAILNNVAGLTAEQQEAAAMHFEIVQAAKTAVNSLLDLGRKLKRMRDSGRYKDLGFACQFGGSGKGHVRRHLRYSGKRQTLF